MARFDGKTILITGGTSGIGRATAERIASEGGQVIVTGTNPDRIAEVGAIPGITAIKNDAGDPNAAKTLAEEVGHLDGVFLNAGFGVFAPHSEVTAEAYAQQFDVNVRGPILQVAALSDKIKEGGSVLLNTSVVQNMGMEGSSIYAPTKGALNTYMKVLARELAPRGIRSNAVSPGPVGSDFFSRTGIPDDEIAAMGEGIKAQVPLGRFGEPREVAAVAVFLLSDDASYVTGSEYTVDGGMTMV